MRYGLVGYGAMGKIVHEMLGDEVICIIGVEANSGLKSLNDFKDKIDVIIDFSNPANLDMILNYCIEKNCKAVLATTGYTDSDYKKINEASKSCAILQSANFSLGVNLLNRLVREISPALKDDFDIEIIEAHHNKKLDSPSGTANMLAKSIVDVTGFKINNGRYGNEKRIHEEIGISSIRGGTIVGEHEVLYCGLDEVITIKHEAFSKKIFAKGAITAAKWLFNKEKGLYNMENVLF